MAGTINPEDAIGAMKSLIESDLAAKLDSLDTTYSATGDEVLDDVSKVFLAPQERIAKGDLPAVILYADGTTNELQEYGERGHWHHAVSCLVVLRNNSRTASLAPDELLAVKVQRTVRGIAELFDANRRLVVSSVQHADDLMLEASQYYEVGDLGDSEVEQAAVMQFIVKVSA